MAKASVLAKFQTGFRMFNGNDLNKIISQLNAWAGQLSGTVYDLYASALNATGAAALRSGTATPAAASAVAALTIGSDNIQLTWGTGAPSAAAPKGSLYIRTDGSTTSTRLYINTDGAGTWTSITTAA